MSREILAIKLIIIHIIYFFLNNYELWVNFIGFILFGILQHVLLHNPLYVMLLDFKLPYDVYVESVYHIIRSGVHLIVLVVDISIEFLLDFLQRFLFS